MEVIGLSGIWRKEPQSCLAGRHPCVCLGLCEPVNTQLLPTLCRKYSRIAPCLAKKNVAKLQRGNFETTKSLSDGISSLCSGRADFPRITTGSVLCIGGIWDLFGPHFSALLALRESWGWTKHSLGRAEFFLQGYGPRQRGRAREAGKWPGSVTRRRTGENVKSLIFQEEREN